MVKFLSFIFLASEKPLSRLKELLYAADRWEEKAKLCLQAKYVFVPEFMYGNLVK